MNRAEQAAYAYTQGTMSWNDVLNEASKIADAYEQDFYTEATWFEYDDGSVGLFLGQTQELLTYGCKQ